MEIAKSGKTKNNKCKKIFRTNNQDATVSKLLDFFELEINKRRTAVFFAFSV